VRAVHDEIPLQLQALADAGFLSELLPIIPPDAEISDASRAPERILSKRGKIPGRWSPNGWVGFGDWSAWASRQSDIERWRRWPDLGIGIQTRRHPAIDLDVDGDDALTAALRAAAGTVFGPLAWRTVEGRSRALTVLSAPLGGIRKRVLLFRRADQDPPHRIEILGEGQQFVAYGSHPKGGRYVWDTELADFAGLMGLPEATPEKLDAFLALAAAEIERAGYQIVMGKGATGDATDAAIVDQAGLQAPSIAAVRDALAKLPNTRDAFPSYDDWYKMCRAIRGATEGLSPAPGEIETGLDLWLAWSAQDAEHSDALAIEKWETSEPPHKIGWPWIAEQARVRGYNDAVHVFGPVAEDARDADTGAAFGGEDETLRPDAEAYNAAVEEMFDQFVWVHELDCAADARTGSLYNRQQFNMRFAIIGPPTKTQECAWARWSASTQRRKSVERLTYRPGGPRFMIEAGATALNTWSPGDLNVPSEAVDDFDVLPWLAHAEWLLPDPRERGLVLDWMAYVLQHPGEKVNWALLIGSDMQGTGKDTLFEPVREALGRANVRVISAETLDSQFTGWAANCRVVEVQEVHSFHRRETLQKLKPYVAAPPEYVRVNEKFQRPYDVPNIAAFLMFTNERDAVAIDTGDRRFCVIWCDVEPKGEEYYTAIHAWYRTGGGLGLVARWLLQRDVSAFPAKGRAPATAAKEMMRKATGNALEQWLADQLDEGGRWERLSLLTHAEIEIAVPSDIRRRVAVNGKTIARAVDRVGGAKLIHAWRCGEPPQGMEAGLELAERSNLYGFKRVSMLRRLVDEDDHGAVRRAYWGERRRA
jgi:hypothetical protein